MDGTRGVELHSIHGSFIFPLQKFEDPTTGTHPTFFTITGEPEPGGLSHRLAEWACYYANRMSFREVETLLERVRGKVLPQTLHNVVHRVADDANAMERQAVADTVNRPMPPVAAKVDVYDASSKEVLVMEDGIVVKAQKPHRGADEKRPYKRANTDVALIQQPDGEFRFVAQDLAPNGPETFTISQAIRAEIVRRWSGADSPLNIVALSDGASVIRQHLADAFGIMVTFILDWYHLTKKLQVLLSQVCHGNVQRKAIQKDMEKLLWHGDVAGALKVLDQVSPRKPDAASDLRGYLTRHAHEIIDYERRQKAGKPIGSGRVEKGVDQTTGSRQKQKGMSWSPVGSRALGHLKCVELNGEWVEFWEQRAAA